MVSHAVILAIGNTSHRSQLTYNRAHAMLPALGKPLFIRIMDRLYRAGIRDYTVIVGESEGAVVSYLNSQWMPDVNISLMIQFQNSTLTQFFKDIAIKLDAPFIVCNYNSFTHTNFPERLMRIHHESPDKLLISGAPTSLSQAPANMYAVIDSNNIIEILKSQDSDRKTMTLGDFYVVGNDMVSYLQTLDLNAAGPPIVESFISLADHYIRSGGEAQTAESNWILQVQTDRDLLTLNKHLLDEGQDAHILSELPYTVKITSPVRIDPQVSVGQGTKLGPHVYLERGCTVGHDVVLQNCIVLARANVPANKTIINAILTTRGPIT